MARRRKSLPTQPFPAVIDDLTHDGRGVAHIDGKTVFIDQALPGEEVHFIYSSRRRQYDEGRLHSIEKPSQFRVEPGCPHFGVCGGCSLQHLGHAEQIRLKQKVLIDNLQRIGHVSAKTIRLPVSGPLWGYRRKARLGVKYVSKKQKVLVGFREKASRYLADLSVCKVLHPSVGEKLSDIGRLVEQLSCKTAIPQVEVAVGDSSVALVFRHLEELNHDDTDLLVLFGKQNNFDIYTQAAGPDSIRPLWPDNPELHYALQDEEIQFDFLASDFVQVNTDINNKMVADVLQALELSAEQNVLELFCGLGNFSLPIAKRVATVNAVEGDNNLIRRARENAASNNIPNVTYHVANLMEDTSSLSWWKSQRYDRIFLDPPRSGATEVIPLINRLRVPRIVYVSCNPATLARDAGILVKEGGYCLQEVGIMDMFPHTAHVESIAIFTRG